jgi:hypothetical protein
MFSPQDGYVFERNLKDDLTKYIAIEQLQATCILNESQIVKSFGKEAFSVDILCYINYKYYAIQCKQVSKPSTSTEVNNFIKSVQHIEKILNKPIEKVWVASIYPSGPGIKIGKDNNVVFICYLDTSILLINTVYGILYNRELLSSDGDTIML